MTGRRTIVGLSLLCALFVCAISASSASAGTTAFTCVPVPSGAQFTDEHCLTKGTGKGFIHEEITVGTTTEITSTNDKTGTPEPAVLHSILGGIEFTIDSEEVHATGSCKNELAADGVTMQNHCKKVFVTYKKLKVTPESLKCEVITGQIKTEELTSVTRQTVTGKGPGVNFTPQAPATVFAKFTLGPKATCKLGEPTIEVKGNAVGKISGATLTFDEGSTKGTESGEGLFIGKSAASYTGVQTVRMLGGNPITITEK
jgi:hypothetical protein